MDVNEALELADGSHLAWAPVLAEEVRSLRRAIALDTELDRLTDENARLRAEMEQLRQECFELHVDDADAIAEQAEELIALRAAIERVRELCNRGIAAPFQGSWAHYVLRALDGEDKP